LREWILPVILGILFSIVNAIIVMYLALKTGMGMGMQILFLLITFFIFAILKNTKKSWFLYILAIVSGSTGIVYSYTDGISAIIISKNSIMAPDYILMVVPLIFGVIGILMSFYFINYFLRPDFPWPQAKVNATLINLYSSVKKDSQFIVLAIRLGIAFIVSGTISVLKGFMLLPEVIGSVNLGIGISPLFIGTGMLMGFSTCIEIAFGALISVSILILFEGSNIDYFTHLRNPFILSPVISMLLTTAALSLYHILRPSIKSVKTKASNKNILIRDGGNFQVKTINMTFINNRIVILIIMITLAALFLFFYFGVQIWLFVITLIISLLFMIIEARSNAEMAMMTGMSSFLIILIIGLAFNDIVPLFIMDGCVLAMASTFALSLSVLKQSELCEIPNKNLAGMLFIGVLTGSIICIPCLKIFNMLFEIGTVTLPAPISVMWLEIAQSTVTKIVSPSINMYLIFLGVILAVILHKYNVSAISISMGLILPVSSSAAIVIGGIIAWYIKKKNYLKNDNNITPSGIIAGDVIASIIMAIRQI
jgi:uncharacterized oligopeptide transporter (OPT) family protein